MIPLPGCGRAAAVSAVLAATGCAATPPSMPSFVEPNTDVSGTVAGELGGLSLSGAGVAVGPTARVTPRVNDRFSIPVEAGCRLAVTSGSLSYGMLRTGVRGQFESGLFLGGGLTGQTTYWGGWGGGGGADVEVGYSRRWERWALSVGSRPQFMDTTLTAPTVWVPSAIAGAVDVRPRLTIYLSAEGAAGVALAGSLGLQVAAVGMTMGVAGRW